MEVRQRAEVLKWGTGRVFQTCPSSKISLSQGCREQWVLGPAPSGITLGSLLNLTSQTRAFLTYIRQNQNRLSSEMDRLELV